MIRLRTLTLATVTFANAIHWAVAAPLVEVTLRNFGDFTAACNRLVKAAKPDYDKDLGQEFQTRLGLDMNSGVDWERAWRGAFWFGGEGMAPIGALMVPVADFDQFQTGRPTEGILNLEGANWISQAGDYAAVVFSPKESLTNEQVEGIEAWKKSPVSQPKSILALAIQSNAGFRAQARAALGSIRENILNSFPPEGSENAPPGIDPEAFREVLSLYFDALDQVVNGVDRVRVDVDLTEKALRFDKRVIIMPESDLAAWTAPPVSGLGRDLLGLLDQRAFASIAAATSDQETVKSWLKRLARTSMRLQYLNLETETLTEMEHLIDAMFPMKFAASVYLQEGLTFGGAYQFPGRDVDELYQKFLAFYHDMIGDLVGEENFYKEAQMIEDHHEVDGVSVDRFDTRINLDHPMFGMPGQKESIQRMWPDGRMVVDYAVSDDRLVFASPDLMASFLKASPDRQVPAAAAAADAHTLLAGQINLLALIRESIASNPIVPAEVKSKFEKIDPSGTALAFRLNSEEGLHAFGTLPIKFISELGRIDGE